MQTEDADSWPLQVEGKPLQSAQVGVTEASFPAVQFDRLQDLLADVPCHHSDDRSGISHKCVARGGRCGPPHEMRFR
jgi:hypothetical protein